jgi:hypothetical protein
MTNGDSAPWKKRVETLKAIGALTTPLAVAGIGIYATAALESRQNVETNIRLYAQLMGAREQADSDLRQQMFITILSTFLSLDDNMTLTANDETLLALELLAYNFHDALDLAPLFKQVNSIIDVEDERGVDYRERLQSVAQEVIDKQVAALGDVGDKVESDFIALDAAGQLEYTPGVIKAHLGSDEEDSELAKRIFQVDVVGRDDEELELTLRLMVWDSNDELELDVTFSVGYFDFPMIDNTRLAGGLRCAIVLSQYSVEAGSAQVTLVYFPGSRASLKQKPYYDEVIEQLKRTRSELGG